MSGVRCTVIGGNIALKKYQKVLLFYQRLGHNNKLHRGPKLRGTICGSLRSLYHKLHHTVWASELGVITLRAEIFLKPSGPVFTLVQSVMALLPIVRSTLEVA